MKKTKLKMRMCENTSTTGKCVWGENRKMNNRERKIKAEERKTMGRTKEKSNADVRMQSDETEVKVKTDKKCKRQTSKK